VHSAGRHFTAEKPTGSLIEIFQIVVIPIIRPLSPQLPVLQIIIDKHGLSGDITVDTEPSTFALICSAPICPVHEIHC